VAVNGQRALVDTDIASFLALLPVDTSVTEVVAVATTRSGERAEARVPITVTPAPEPKVTLRASPAAGAAPLDVTFKVTSLTPIAHVAVDLDGDGVFDFEGDSVDGHFFTYQRPGIYMPRIVVTDDAGVTDSVTGAVRAYDAMTLDRALRDQWAALGGAVARGDVPAAAQVVAQSRRDAYRAQLEGLAAAGLLGQLAADLGGINLMRFLEGAVEYDLRLVRDGVEYSFHVVFVEDVDGVWRLWAF
jgi:hypothetical protein